jgi:hypothetical protein
LDRIDDRGHPPVEFPRHFERPGIFIV